LNRELAGLPAKFGFSDLGASVRAVKAAAGGKRGRPAKAPVLVKRRKRAKITDAIRARVKKLVKAGRTGSQIAKALKISLPSVQNIKKAFGLVRTSKKPARRLVIGSDGQRPPRRRSKDSEVARSTKEARCSRIKARPGIGSVHAGSFGLNPAISSLGILRCRRRRERTWLSAD
jgi:hypothetical protein